VFPICLADRCGLASAPIDGGHRVYRWESVVHFTLARRTQSILVPVQTGGSMILLVETGGTPETVSCIMDIEVDANNVIQKVEIVAQSGGQNTSSWCPEVIK
jgi:hypothetical protein